MDHFFSVYYLININMYFWKLSGWHLFLHFPVTHCIVICFIVPGILPLEVIFTSCFPMLLFTADQRDRSNVVLSIKIWPTFTTQLLFKVLIVRDKWRTILWFLWTKFQWIRLQCSQNCASKKCWSGGIRTADLPCRGGVAPETVWPPRHPPI